jgi:uncharacterized protein YwqG
MTSPDKTDVAASTAPLAVPAVHVVVDESPTASHFGGQPGLPRGVDWPKFGREKLQFLARLSLPELHAASPVDWLPKEGALLFFYDLEGEPWGDEPADKGSCAVLLVPEPSVLSARRRAVGADDDTRIAHTPIKFRRIEVRPARDRPEVAALKLDEAGLQAYDDLLDAPFNGLPRHQVDGFASPVQADDMALECERVANGSATPEAGAANWRLLLQFDSDGGLDVMWADSGTLYIWVEEARARAGDFTNAWAVLQSE